MLNFQFFSINLLQRWCHSFIRFNSFMVISVCLLTLLHLWFEYKQHRNFPLSVRITNCVILIFIRYLFWNIILYISSILVRYPKMSFQYHINTTYSPNIAAHTMITTNYRIYQTTRVVFLNPRSYLHSLEIKQIVH